MTTESEKPKKGFAGLNNMVSVVDVPEPPSNASGLSENESTSPARGSPLEFSLPAAAPEVPFWKKTWFKWVLGIFILLIIIATFNDEKDNKTSYSNTNNSNATSTYTPLLELMPPVGTDITLTNDQIRYCLSENIRLGAWETAVNSKSDDSVNVFNNAIESYNSRCSSYRYKEFAMSTVKSQVEALRAELIAEGLRKAALYSSK